jgi:hypothetical protein
MEKLMTKIQIRNQLAYLRKLIRRYGIAHFTKKCKFTYQKDFDFIEMWVPYDHPDCGGEFDVLQIKKSATKWLCRVRPDYGPIEDLGLLTDTGLLTVCNAFVFIHYLPRDPEKFEQDLKIELYNSQV